MHTTAAHPDMVPFLLQRMTSEERDRLEAVTDGHGEARLRHNVAISDLTWAGIDAAGVVNLGGVFPLIPGVGYVWQVITPAIARHKRAYIRQGRAMRTAALAAYPSLTTIIAASYGPALRHIGRLGFDVAPAVDVNGTAACRCDCERGF